MINEKMILKKPNPFGWISGKLKIDKSIALKLFDFKMKPNENEIIFKIKNGKQIISHSCSPTQRITPKVIRKNKIFKTISKLANKLSIVNELWEPLANHQKFTGRHLFIRENMKNIYHKNNWENLTISKGNLPRPKVKYAYYLFPQRYIKLLVFKSISNKLPHKLNIILIDPENLIVKDFSTYRLGNLTLSTSQYMKKPIVSLYFTNKKPYHGPPTNNFSDSLTIIPKFKKQNPRDSLPCL